MIKTTRIDNHIFRVPTTTEVNPPLSLAFISGLTLLLALSFQLTQHSPILLDGSVYSHFHID